METMDLNSVWAAGPIGAGHCLVLADNGEERESDPGFSRARDGSGVLSRWPVWSGPSRVPHTRVRSQGLREEGPRPCPPWPLREGGADLLLVGRSGGHFHAQTCVSAWQRWSRVQSSRTHSGLGSPCRCPQPPTPLPARSRDVLYVLQIPGWRPGNRQIRLPFKHGSN